MSQLPVRYRVWVGGLPPEIQREDLYGKFSKYGPITDITIRSSEADTYSFITYAERHDAEEAIARMDRSCAWGAPVKVNISKDFAPNGPRPRGADGKPLNESMGFRPLSPVRPSMRYSPSPRRLPPRRSPPRRSPLRRSPPNRLQRRRRSPLRHDHRGRRCPSYGSRRSRSCGRRGQRWESSRIPRPPSPPSVPRGYSSERGRVSPVGRRRSSSTREYDEWLYSIGGGLPHNQQVSLNKPRSVPPPVGKHQITIENVPDDMGWLELKDLGRQYGRSVTFSRTFRRGSICFGMLEFMDPQEAHQCIRELDGRRIEGGTAPMRVYMGDRWNT